MRITFILAQAGLEGGVRVIATYAERLKQRGHDVQVVSVPHARPTLKQQVKSLLRGKGILSVPRRPPSHLDYIDVPHYIIDRNRPVTDADVPDADVVIATWWETAEWVMQLSPAKGAKAYLIQHYEIFDYLPKERVKATWRLPLAKITVSKWLADIARMEYNDDNVYHIPNSVEFSQFYAPPRGKQPVPTVGMVYSSNYWKGCDTALQAFKIAASKMPNLRLVSFGLEQMPLQDLPSGQVSFSRCPEQDQLHALYAQCDAWLFPSRSEGFGLPIVEAMACRTPVIGTPAGVGSEMLSRGGGILVEPDNPDAMARAIIDICRLPEQEWLAMSELAYQRATSYSWDDATDLMVEALQAVAEKKQFKQLCIT